MYRGHKERSEGGVTALVAVQPANIVRSEYESMAPHWIYDVGEHSRLNQADRDEHIAAESAIRYPHLATSCDLKAMAQAFLRLI